VGNASENLAPAAFFRHCLMMRFIQTFLVLLCSATFLFADPSEPIIIADMSNAHPVLEPGYPTAWYMDLPNPAHRGLYNLFVSPDLGRTWIFVLIQTFPDPRVDPPVRVFINPDVNFVWYQFVRVSGHTPK
jgi:hypothetical protein